MWAAVTLVAITGLALRVTVLRSPLGPLDADEAAGMLVVRHLAHGEWSTFLWGNAYGGTLEGLVAAPVYRLWSSPVVLKLVMIGLYALACGLTWRIGLRTVGAAAARLAAGLLWVAPVAFVIGSTKGRMYYGASLVLALGVVLVCLRLAEARSRRDTALLGLLLGLGLWTAPFVFYVALPAVVWLLTTRRAVWRDIPLAVPTALLGAAPWLVFNLRNHWLSLHPAKWTIPTSYRARLDGFFHVLLPGSLGLRLNVTLQWLGGPVAKLAYLALLVAFAVLALHCLVRRPSPLAPLVVIAAGYPFLLAVPEASQYVGEPRYALFLAPIIALLLAAGVCRLARAPALQMAVLALAALGTVSSLHAIQEWSRANPGHWDLAAPVTGPAQDDLEHSHTRFAYGEYWVAYPITLASHERVVVTPVDVVRYEPYRRAALAAGASTYVFFSGSAAEAVFLDKMAQKPVAVRRSVDGAVVVYRLDHPLSNFP